MRFIYSSSQMLQIVVETKAGEYQERTRSQYNIQAGKITPDDETTV